MRIRSLRWVSLRTARAYPSHAGSLGPVGRWWRTWEGWSRCTDKHATKDGRQAWWTETANGHHYKQQFIISNTSLYAMFQYIRCIIISSVSVYQIYQYKQSFNVSDISIQATFRYIRYIPMNSISNLFVITKRLQSLVMSEILKN